MSAILVWLSRRDRVKSHPREDNGNGEALTETATKEERAAHYALEDEEDAILDYNSPILWWFVSTLFPLTAGTFGPMASAFNIMAIAIDWRTTVSPSSTESEGTHIADPTWLLAINGVSLAIAIIANISLLGQMTDRIRYNISAPITIIGWYISSFLLLGLVSAAPKHLPLPANDKLSAYSQAYYYACFSAAIYFVLSTMLTMTATGVWIFHFSRGYKLTLSQRSLMLQTIMFLTYLLAGGAVYCRIEGWDYLDAVYFVNVSLFTIGFGEFTPKTHLGRSLFFPFSIGGILFVGLIIASIRTLVLESGSRKISTRMVEKARHKAIKHGDPATGTFKLRGFQERKVESHLSELDRREQEFEIMREVQRQAANDNRTIALAVSAMSFFFLWFVGAAVFWQAEKGTGGEDWSYFESMYFTFVALITVGYGDFYPQTNSAKPAFVFWSLIALPTLTVLIGSIGDAVSEYIGKLTLWLGGNLPETFKALRRLKGTAQKKKKRDGAFQKTKPPGFMSDGAVGDGEYDDEAHAKAVQGMTEDQETQGRSNAAAAGESYWLYLVMKQMKQVVQDLDTTPPRKYTYAEWSWIMKLINEDEADAQGHRRHWHPEHLVAAPLREHELQVWSWMGQESPLMTTQDEPKWVLQKLIAIVEREVKKKGDYEMEKKGEGPANEEEKVKAGDTAEESTS